MAKMFYTMEETKVALGRTEDEIRQLAKDGKLREFRDGPRLMFKADQVETLKGELADGGTQDQIGLTAGDTHTPLGLMDSKSSSGSGTAIGIKGDSSVAPSPRAASPTAPASKSDSTSDTDDVGLSGSLSGSIGGGSLAGGSLSSSGSGLSSSGSSGIGSSRVSSRHGINVFGDEGGGEADPMAQTHMSAAKDQISLEGVGSGSGLLDLTRETDDTSLGAALLDEISPGGRRNSPTPGAAPSSGSTAGMTSISPIEIPSERAPVESAPAMVPAVFEAPDPVAPAFGAASIAASLMVLFAAMVMINALVSSSPLIDARLGFLRGENAAYIVLGVGFLLSIILFFAGIVAGRNRAIA